MSIGYGMAVDAEGNTVTTLEELNAAYASAGCEDMEYATINGIPCMSCCIKASDVGGVAFLFDDGTQLTFNFSPCFLRRKLRRGDLRYPLLYHAR